MSDSSDLYQGLQALAETAFPKRCRSCNRLYHDAAAFIRETKRLNKGSGLQSSEHADGTQTVELFRNCPCGSTLMDVFNNRRDLSENGIKRRNNFDKLMTMVEQQYQVDSSTARAELLKIMQGETSQVIKHILPVGAANKPQQTS